MQVNIFGNTAVVGIEITVVPLIPRSAAFFFVTPRVVNTGSQNIFTAIIYFIRNIETKSHHTVFAHPYGFSVQVKFTTEPDTFKFQKYFLIFGRCG